MRETVDIPISSNLKQMMDKCSDEQKQLIAQAVAHYMDEYKKAKGQVGGMSAAHAFHNLIEKELGSETTQSDQYFKRIACTKGCGFCCFINVDINEDEAELLVQYCKEEGIKIDVERLKLQSDKDEKTYKNLALKDRKCVFLSDEMTCKVYEHRPSACRKFFALDSNEVCKSDKEERHALFGNAKLEIYQIALCM